MFWKKIKWHKAADNDAEIKLNENGIGVVMIEGIKICVTKHRDKWFAFAYNCPHAGGIMSEGYIDSTGSIVCPVHSYKFSLRNGMSKMPEGFCLKIYPIDLRKDGFFIGL
jgi:nitrite reductase/ring-hydroxylating ferredoxin subunit